MGKRVFGRGCHTIGGDLMLHAQETDLLSPRSGVGAWDRQLPPRVSVHSRHRSRASWQTIVRHRPAACQASRNASVVVCRRRLQRRHHPLARRLRPLRRLIRKHKNRRQGVRPARIGTDAMDASTCHAILDSRLLCGIPNFPPALVFELVAHEGDNVLESNIKG